MELSELKERYHEALRKEDDYREKIFAPVRDELTMLCKNTREAYEKIEEFKLEIFKEALGNRSFLEADWSKLDIEWLLWTDGIGRGKKVYEYREDLFKELKFVRPAGHYNPDEEQVVLSVSMSKDSDEADIEEVANIIFKLTDYLKPYRDKKYYFDIFEDNLSETRFPTLTSKDGYMWVVKNERWGETYVTGSLRECLRYISQNLYYSW